ncbi:MAG TPA: hypothetical protein ENK49_05365 [Gammaproteobacteria bacterium]|nr:hypothetical protein [Gammaproteobacteria bacterium]
MNLHTLGMVNIFYLFITPLVFTLGIGALLWAWRHRLPEHSWPVRVALLSALFVAASFLGALSSPGQLEKLHKVEYGEIYHYYMGSKYYRELKNTELYRCTWLGFQELSERGYQVPHTRIIRDLEVVWAKEDLGKLRRQVHTRCNNRFTADRWEQFMADLAVFLEVRNSSEKWHRIFVDYGNNPPPTWNVMAGTASNLIPLTPTLVRSVKWIDVVLTLGLVPLVIWRVFGLIPATGFVLLAGMQPMLPPGMDGAAFFRQIWLVALGLGICALYARRFVLAGLLLGFSTSIRVFPAVFAFGAGLPLLWAWRDLASRRALLQLIGGACAAGGTLVALSLVVYGLEHWRSFLAIIDSSANILSLNSIGFKRHLLSFVYTEANLRTYVQGAVFTGGLPWYQYLDSNLEDMRTYLFAYTGAILLLTGAVAVRVRPVEAAMLVGTVCLFFLTSAYGYYYVFLPLFAAVWLAEKFDWRPMSLLLWLLGVFLVIAWYFPLHYPGLIAYYTAASNVMFTAIVGMVVTAFGFLYREEITDMLRARQLHPASLVLLATAVSLVAGAAWTLGQA